MNDILNPIPTMNRNSDDMGMPSPIKPRAISIREQIMALRLGELRDSENAMYSPKEIRQQSADLAEARERELLERQAAMIAELRDVRRAIAYAAQSDNVMLAVYNKLDMAINNYGEP
jgi:hypothetical protein